MGEGRDEEGWTPCVTQEEEDQEENLVFVHLMGHQC